MLWRSPLWMPLAWEVVTVQLSCLGLWLWQRYGGGAGLLLVGILGAINIPYYEEMARHIHWWSYTGSPMLLHTPWYIILGEFGIAIVLTLLARLLPGTGIMALLALGLVGGAGIFVCYALAYLGLLRMAALAVVCSLLASCDAAVFAIANAPARLSTVHLRSNLAYGDQQRQHLDVYAPPQAHGVPVVIFWYGGSWTSGDKSDYRFVGSALAESGFVAVLPDYRLYPTAIFPAFIEDGAQAVAWVEQHAEEFGGDHTRIVLMGHSAGAHLAAMLALAPAYLRGAGASGKDIVGLVGLSGPYVLDPDTTVLRTIFSSPFQPAQWQPVRYAAAHAPPALLLHGLDDHRVLPIQTRQLRDALISNEVSVEMELYEGLSHADTVAGFSVFERNRVPTLERIVRFVRRVTAPEPREAAAH